MVAALVRSLFIVLVVVCGGCAGKGDGALAQGKSSVLRSETLPVEGSVDKMARVVTSSGERLILCTKTHRMVYASETNRGEEPRENNSYWVYVYDVRLDKDTTQIDLVYRDSMIDCQAYDLRYYDTQECVATDLDEDGILEIWVWFQRICSDIGTERAENILVMIEGDTVYRNSGFISETETNLASLDKAFAKADPRFKEYATNMWNDWDTY